MTCYILPTAFFCPPNITATRLLALFYACIYSGVLGDISWRSPSGMRQAFAGCGMPSIVP